VGASLPASDASALAVGASLPASDASALAVGASLSASDASALAVGASLPASDASALAVGASLPASDASALAVAVALHRVGLKRAPQEVRVCDSSLRWISAEGADVLLDGEIPEGTVPDDHALIHFAHEERCGCLHSRTG